MAKKTTTLHKIIAKEKSVKSRTESTVTALYKQQQKTDLFGGFVKSYTPVDEDGERLQSERKVVRANAEEILAEAATTWTELFDLTATKELGNAVATADVVVDGKTLVTGATVPLLLFLEKRLTDMRTIVTKMPTLSADFDWTKDEAKDLWVTQPVSTRKTKKQPKVIVKYEATENHPAQTELFNEDVLVGHWSSVHHCGAIPVSRKKELTARVNKVLDAVKEAREEANSTQVTNAKIGSDIFNFILE